MSEQGRLITINGVNFLAGMNWNSEQQHHSLIFGYRLKKIAQESGLFFGTSVDKGRIDGQKKSSFQYALCDDLSKISSNELLGSAKEPVFSGAQFISEHITNWVGKYPGKTIVFIKSIDLDDETFTDRNYWICATSQSGHIIGEFDMIVKDRFNLISQIENITITEDAVFAILDSEADIKSDIYAYSDKTGIKREEVIIDLIEQPIFQRIAKNYDKPIKRLYKDSTIKVEKVGLGILILGAVTTIFFAFSYATQAGSMLQLSREYSIIEATKLSNRYNETLKNLKGSSQWTPEEFRKATLEEFIDDMKHNLYSPLNASLIIREINRSLPLYSVEWEMSTIEYQNGRFLVTYERIQNSKGVYFLLDEKIDNIQKNNDGLFIAPFALENEANTRIYIIKPDFSLAAQFESEAMLSNLREESKLNSLYQRAVKKAKDSYDDQIVIHNKYAKLSFSDKWFKMKANTLSRNLDDVLGEIKKFDKNKKEIELEIRKLRPLKLDDKLIGGDVMDFVTMAQLDSMFSWSKPIIKHTYPNLKTLEERNKSKNKKNVPNKDLYSAAIEAYEVVISNTQSNRMGKIKTYGVNDMITLGTIIDRPYIHTRNIIYNKMTDQWTVTIQFNKKTIEYERRVADARDNKEVSNEEI